MLMSKYEEGLKAIEEICGNNKDNVISLATIATELSADGNPIPLVRDVDAYYEDGVFYVVTYAKSNKMLQIAQNKEVGFSVNFEGFCGKNAGSSSLTETFANADSRFRYSSQASRKKRSFSLPNAIKLTFIIFFCSCHYSAARFGFYGGG